MLHIFFNLAEQRFIKKHALNWCCLTLVLKQIMNLYITECTTLFCSRKLWIKKSYLNFVPVQIKTLIFSSLTIHLPKTHPSICRCISLEYTCYSLTLVASSSYFQGCWHQFTWKFPFHISVHKKAHPAWAEFILQYGNVKEMSTEFCAFSASHFFAVTLLFLWWLFLLALGWTDHESL